MKKYKARKHKEALIGTLIVTGLVSAALIFSLVVDYVENQFGLVWGVLVLVLGLGTTCYTLMYKML